MSRQRFNADGGASAFLTMDYEASISGPGAHLINKSHFRAFTKIPVISISLILTLSIIR